MSPDISSAPESRAVGAADGSTCPRTSSATPLAQEVWVARRDAHHARVDAWTSPVLERARRGQRHPVEDFLFSYYSHRPAQLRRWSPGAGVVLTGPAARELVGSGSWVGAGDGAALAQLPQRVRRTAGWVAQLLERTARHPAHFGCFGLHEWAMVHRASPEEVRHARWPLRLGPEATTELVETLPVRCSHYDAFRFFAPSARALNVLQPARDTQAEHEQGGCLHANMDLYKWAYKLSPWVESELVADCFDLARRVRELDMRASPYDLQALGYEPVRIETAQGRADYAAAQRAFAAEAAPLRDALTVAARRLS
ncbi:MAG: 3-methyladenine DNA glycosylase [Actinomycetota bacterium]|nr:3-methyladenine DNA glycosylase [Actinomycetota bacterium]